MKVRSFCIVVAAAVAASHAHADAVSEIGSILKGSAESVSEDRRKDVMQEISAEAEAFGVKGKVKVGEIKLGCKGDTVEASVKITNVSGKEEGDKLTLLVSYEGSYARYGYDIPCVRVPKELRGEERLGLSGTYEIIVQAKRFQKPTVTWVGPKSLGEKSDPGHDSNKMALKALEGIINRAF
jgi:hypothetical protein